MPNVIDPGDTERENLAEFVKKHLPCRLYTIDVEGRVKGLFKDKPVVAVEYFFEDQDEEDVKVARIDLSQPDTINVFDRSFLEDFTELAAKYERYNSSVTVTVIVKKPEAK